MGIFDGTVPPLGGDEVPAAVTAIRRRAEVMNLLSAPWSLAELCADEEDYEWLRAWGQALNRRSLGLWLGCPWLMFTAGGEQFSRPAGIGLLLLFLFAELARREANEGTVWPFVRRFPFQAEVAAALFVNGQPNQTLKDALEAAASESQGFRLRHVFGIQGLQNWFDTVYLQFGFTERGFHRRLAGWLTGQGLTQAVKRLTDPQNGSPTFIALWQSFRSFRQRNLSEQRLRQVIRSSPWVLPAWENDLVREASRQIEYVVSESDEPPEATFLCDPVLRWTPPGEPSFVCRVSGLADFDLTEPAYWVSVSGRNVSRLLRQADGGYQAAPEEIVIPAARSSLVAALTTDQGQAIKTVALKLWEEADDVTVFRLPSGQKDAREKPLHPAQSYAVLAAGDLAFTPQALNWTSLANGAWRLYLLTPGWPLETRLLLADDILWQPAVGAGMAVVEPQWAEQVGVVALGPDGAPRHSVHTGETRPLRICHPHGVTVLLSRFRHQSIQASDVTPTATTTTPVCFSWEHLGKPVGVHLTLQRGATILRVRRPLLSAVTGCARLGTDGWQLLEGSCCLTLEQARSELFLVGTKSMHENLRPISPHEWALVEGEVWVGSPPRLPRCLGFLCGLGAPLTLWEGPYNNTAEPVVLASEVVDTGIVRGAVQLGDKVRIRLDLRIEPDSGHQVIFWEADGSISQARPSLALQEPAAHFWEVARPEETAPWLAVAVGYNGSRLGAHWTLDWHAHLDSGDAGRIASLARWFRLPLLSQACLPQIRQFAHAHVAEVLPAWLRDTCGVSALTWAPADDGWLAAVRSVFFDWYPTDPYEVETLVDEFTGQSADADAEQLLGPVVFQLTRVDPALMGKVVECWMRHIYPKWHGEQGRAELLARLSDLLLAGRTLQAARAEVATTMKCDENFVEVELVGQSLRRLQGSQQDSLDSLHRSNLLLGLNVEPFRRLLAGRVLQDIARRL